MNKAIYVDRIGHDLRVTEGGKTYRGSGTVWYHEGSGQRVDSRKEALLSDITTRFKWWEHDSKLSPDLAPPYPPHETLIEEPKEGDLDYIIKQSQIDKWFKKTTHSKDDDILLARRIIAQQGRAIYELRQCIKEQDDA